MNHMRALLMEIKSYDNEVLVNRFETEQGGEEKILETIPSNINSMKQDEIAHPVLHHRNMRSKYVRDYEPE